jgi:hypothetical protein
MLGNGGILCRDRALRILRSERQLEDRYAINFRSFFVEVNPGSSTDFVNYSFITLTTVGYGDFAAAYNIGRLSSVVEALFGQLYLVSVVALLVSNVGRVRRPQ